MDSNLGTPYSASLPLRVVVNTIYLLAFISGVLLLVYGLYLFIAGAIVVPAYALFGISLGLPLIVLGIVYLLWVLGLSFATRWKVYKYKPRSWLLTLLALLLFWGAAYGVSQLLRGI
jgi:hypothetical protein